MPQKNLPKTQKFYLGTLGVTYPQIDTDLHRLEKKTQRTQKFTENTEIFFFAFFAFSASLR